MSELALVVRHNPIYLPEEQQAQTNMDSDSEEEDAWAEPQNSHSVVVEYEFFDIPETSLDALPRRVTEAVETLVRRRRVPSDDDVREMVHSNCTPMGSPRSTETAASARVRVVLAHSVAVDLAMHRSFNEGGNVQQTAALTSQELSALLSNSRQIIAQRNDSSTLEDASCVVCMETVDVGGDCVALSPCKHMFHKDCIAKWLERLPRACPMCKSDVNLTVMHPPGAVTRSRARAMQRATATHDAEEEVCL